MSPGTRSALATPRLKTRTTSSVDAFRFAPEVGGWRTHLMRLVRLAKQGRDELHAYLDREANAVLAEVNDPKESLSADRLRWGYALSILDDLLTAGGTVFALDSELYASWPDWSAATGRDLARSALLGVEPPRKVTAAEARRIEPMVASDMSSDDLRRFMRDAQFWLEPVTALHPSGDDYTTAFTVGLRNWTMPYRGRSGRSRRFVVVGQASTSAAPVVVGLIEIGDEAPYSTERDQLLVLQPSAFHEWFTQLDDPRSVANDIAVVFRGLREAVLPVDGYDVPERVEDVLAVAEAIQIRASGRSQSEVGHQEKKRLAYALRLAQGQRVFEDIVRGANLRIDDPSLREGIRAIHDLTVPRVHMEATICGALPPFSGALAGKLVVSFLAHPEVLGSTKGSPGEIVKSLFDVDRIADVLPDCGMLALTTKGLYPGHSALYNRACVPSSDGAPARLRKLGETRGESTMLVKERTARLAQRIAEGARESGRVALVYGTGGSKRMRFLESAAVECGLPKRIVHAGIKRPIYGIRFARNVADVVWRAQEPEWIVDPALPTEAYSQRATELWRDRWGDRAAAAAAAHGTAVPGLISTIENRG